ncbi:MAG: DUF1919 domain-containing protein [Cyclobacteriaceae bacterium]|nr:DUF1919 domain-containing protein [Cyclobacteriaceae bacterium]
MNILLKAADWLQRKLKASYLRHNLPLLQVKDFTVVSNNCWGGILYQDLKLPYQTPFVNMFMFADCYLKLATDFKTYMQKELRISDQSRYFTHPATYPVGHLGDVEIHFIHYTFQQPVAAVWARRTKRINYDKLFFVLSERDGCNAQHVHAFLKLPFPKLAFTRYRYNSHEAFRIFPFQAATVLPADVLMGFSYRVVHPIRWINTTFAAGL